MTGRIDMYSREEIITSIASIVNFAPEILYNDHYVKTVDKVNGVRINEIVAETLLKHLDALSKIEQITREKSYKTPNHESLAKKIRSETSNRNEEWIAKGLYHQEIIGLGKILDFQIPLKNVQEDKAGKVDLLSYDKISNIAHLLELKVPSSSETLLRCILEIFTYWSRVNRTKLLKDFELPDAELRKGILIYENSQPYKDFYLDECKSVRMLMRKLEVDFFVFSEDNVKMIIKQE